MESYFTPCGIRGSQSRHLNRRVTAHNLVNSLESGGNDRPLKREMIAELKPLGAIT